jgi:hypothetical protein
VPELDGQLAVELVDRTAPHGAAAGSAPPDPTDTARGPNRVDGVDGSLGATDSKEA